MTSARVRRPADAQRLSELVARPGIDPRTWVSAARVDAHSRRWESAYGWVVDVTFYGGGLDEPEVTARVLGTGPTGDGCGEYLPPSDGVEVLVGLPDGDPDGGPVVLGVLRNQSEQPPAEIHGRPIDGAAEASTELKVSPFDTELKVSPHSRREQYAGALAVAAEAISLIGRVNLASEEPGQSAVRGDDLVDALGTLLDGLDVMAAAFAGMTGPLAPFQAVGTNLSQALLQARQGLAVALSERVKLD